MYTWNMKALPLMIQNLWQILKFAKDIKVNIKVFRSRSKVTFKVTRWSNFDSYGRVSLAEFTCQNKVFISCGSKVMAKVKVFRYVGRRSVTRPLDYTFIIIGKAWSQEMYMWNIKALSLMVQKVLQRLKFRNVGQRSRLRSSTLLSFVRISLVKK